MAAAWLVRPPAAGGLASQQLPSSSDLGLLGLEAMMRMRAPAGAPRLRSRKGALACHIARARGFFWGSSANSPQISQTFEQVCSRPVRNPSARVAGSGGGYAGGTMCALGQGPLQTRAGARTGQLRSGLRGAIQCS
jgi:hypothetical protein